MLAFFSTWDLSFNAWKFNSTKLLKQHSWNQRSPWEIRWRCFLVILRESYTPHKWWISCEYMRLPRLRSLPVTNQNRSTILGFWAMNIEVTQQNTEHLWSATVDPTFLPWHWFMIFMGPTRPWRPSLLLVHGLRSPGTNPGNSMGFAPRFP